MKRTPTPIRTLEQIVLKSAPFVVLTAPLLAAAVFCLALILPSPARAQGLATLDSIVAAHGVNRVAPVSVQMTGTVDRNGKVESFRLLATRDEELRIEYGSAGKETVVASLKVAFRTDGTTTTFTKTPSRFSELDVTGLFLVEHLRNRAVRVEAAKERMTIGNVPVQRITVQSERRKTSLGMPSINDRVDLYIAESGMLTGLSRSFFEGRPERYTEGFLFSDYRKTQGVMLPYRIELYLKGKRLQVFQVDTYDFDVPSDRTLFLPRRAQ